jgi:TetR/AcrR family transcriptional regulator, copper-responsive repressor
LRGRFILFPGSCIERNLKSGKGSSPRKIDNFMTALRNH